MFKPHPYPLFGGQCRTICIVRHYENSINGLTKGRGESGVLVMSHNNCGGVELNHNLTTSPYKAVKFILPQKCVGITNFPNGLPLLFLSSPPPPFFHPSTPHKWLSNGLFPPPLLTNPNSITFFSQKTPPKVITPKTVLFSFLPFTYCEQSGRSTRGEQ